MKYKGLDYGINMNGTWSVYRNGKLVAQVVDTDSLMAAIRLLEVK